VPRTGHALLVFERGGVPGERRTVTSCEIVVQPAVAPSRVSLTCHFPGTGAATSAVQKYGGPPRCSRDVTATAPPGAKRDNSPVPAVSVATTTRSGAPFHGARGEVSTAMSEGLSQVADWTCALVGNVAAIRSNAAVTTLSCNRCIASPRATQR
jgi:hypothetical protein